MQVIYTIVVVFKISDALDIPGSYQISSVYLDQTVQSISGQAGSHQVWNLNIYNNYQLMLDYYYIRCN